MVTLSLLFSFQGQGVMEVFCAFKCSVDNFIIIWTILSVALKVLIHLPAIVLAFLTRKVKVDALNDSRSTIAIIHISTVLNVLIFVASFALATFHNAVAVFLSTLIFLNSMIFLAFTFIPKVSWTALYIHSFKTVLHIQMVALYKDPKGERIFNSSTATVATTNTVKRSDMAPKSAHTPSE